MPFKHYIRRVEGREEPEEKQLRVYKELSQYCVELPDHILKRCYTLYPSAPRSVIWGIWRNSKEEAIRAYELATDEQLRPASFIGGKLRYSKTGKGEYV